jgi:hypothetical protein
VTSEDLLLKERVKAFENIQNPPKTNWRRYGKLTVGILAAALIVGCASRVGTSVSPKTLFWLALALAVLYLLTVPARRGGIYFTRRPIHGVEQALIVLLVIVFVVWAGLLYGPPVIETVKQDQQPTTPPPPPAEVIGARYGI